MDDKAIPSEFSKEYQADPNKWFDTRLEEIFTIMRSAQAAKENFKTAENSQEQTTQPAKKLTPS